MYTENIIRDLKDIIWDTILVANNTKENKKEADRTFVRVVEGEEYTEAGYETVAGGLIDASDALDKAVDAMNELQDRLFNLIEKIEMEALSAKVQSK
jgi:hypothetical protein